MRVSVSAMILLLTITLSAWGWSAPPAQPPEQVDRPSVSGDLADDAAAQEQPCEGEKEPGLLASVFGRFLNPSECDPHWCFTADAVALQRTSARAQPLFVGTPTIAAPPTLLSAGEMGFPAALGFQLDAVRRGPSGWEWEIGYFQIDGFNANSTVPGDSLMVISSDGAVIGLSDGEANYRSAIHLAEINLRRQWCDGLTLLVGFRTGELDELYTADGFGANGGLAASVNANTYNHLYGFQTGGIYEFYNMGGPLRDQRHVQSRHLRQLGHPEYPCDRLQRHWCGRHAGRSSQPDGVHGRGRRRGQLRRDVAFVVPCVLHGDVDRGRGLGAEQIGANNFTTLTAGIDTHGGIFYYGGGLGAELKF